MKAQDKPRDTEPNEALETVEHHTPAFAVVPEWAIFTDRLTNTQYRVYTMLCLYANKYDRAWPKVETLAEKAGISHQAISLTIRQLAKLGLVTVSKTGFPARNRYLVYRGTQPPSAWTQEELQPEVDTGESAASCNPTLHQLQSHVAEVATSEVAEEHTNRTDHKNIVSNDEVIPTSLASPERRTRKGVDFSALKRDELTQALIVCLDREPATRREWDQWRLAINDMHSAGITSDDIPRAIRGYQVIYPKSHITPLALVSHWSEIREGKPHELAQHEITRRTAEIEERARQERERAERERRTREADEVERYMLEHGYGARA